MAKFPKQIKGDEAVVRLVKREVPLIGRGRQLVVRRQELEPPLETPRQRRFEGFKDNLAVFLPATENFHYFNYHALRLAHLLEPQHFVEPRALRLIKVRGVKTAETYSVFVPDENGVIERRGKAMALYYKQRRRRDRKRVVAAADAVERRRVPGLRELAKKFEKWGITVPHPEANYHLCNGKPVFTEIERIDLGRLLPHIYGLEERERNRVLVQVSGLLASAFVHRLNSLPEGPAYPYFSEYSKMKRADLIRLFYSKILLRRKDQHFEPSDIKSNDFFKNLLYYHPESITG